MNWENKLQGKYPHKQNIEIIDLSIGTWTISIFRVYSSKQNDERLESEDEEIKRLNDIIKSKDKLLEK